MSEGYKEQRIHRDQFCDNLIKKLLELGLSFNFKHNEQQIISGHIANDKPIHFDSRMPTDSVFYPSQLPPDMNLRKNYIESENQRYGYSISFINSPPNYNSEVDDTERFIKKITVTVSLIKKISPTRLNVVKVMFTELNSTLFNPENLIFYPSKINFESIDYLSKELSPRLAQEVRPEDEETLYYLAKDFELL